MKAVTKAVIELGGEFKRAKTYCEGRIALWMLYDGSYQALDDGKFCSGEYICTREEFQAERERLFQLYTKRSPFIAISFKDWLKTYKEDDDMWMPEVGEEYLYKLVGSLDMVRIVYEGREGQVCVVNKDNDIYVVMKDDLRPIQSEEDKLVERMVNDASEHGPECDATFCRALVKENYRKIKPMTEDEFVSHFNKKFTGYSKVTAQKIYRAGCRFLDV